MDQILDTGTIRTLQTDDLARRNLERDTIDGDNPAEPPRELTCINNAHRDNRVFSWPEFEQSHLSGQRSSACGTAEPGDRLPGWLRRLPDWNWPLPTWTMRANQRWCRARQLSESCWGLYLQRVSDLV
jgi:hypothetical protein